VLSDTQTALLIRKAMLEALPAIIAAASKPMEQIDKIRSSTPAGCMVCGRARMGPAERESR
jgi:hypothetical protein